MNALKAAMPKHQRGMIRLIDLWRTTSGYSKAVASVPRGVFTKMNRGKIGFFLCRVQLSNPPPPRCYQCHDFEHFAKTCRSLKLGGTCRRCAGNHSTNDCTEPTDRRVARGIPPVAHKPGFAQCGARKLADKRGVSGGQQDPP